MPEIFLLPHYIVRSSSCTHRSYSIVCDFSSYFKELTGMVVFGHVCTFHFEPGDDPKSCNSVSNIGLHLTILPSWDMNHLFGYSKYFNLILICAKTNHSLQKLDILTCFAFQEISKTRVAVTIPGKINCTKECESPQKEKN